MGVAGIMSRNIRSWSELENILEEESLPDNGDVGGDGNGGEPIYG